MAKRRLPARYAPPITEDEQQQKRGAKAFLAKRSSTAGQLASAARAQRGNVVGVGIGIKRENGKISSLTRALRIYVRSKLPARALSRSETIPGTFDSLQTDVIEVGDIIARQSTARPRERVRPIVGGISVGHPNVTAGTLGCFLRRGNRTYILSNNHILADTNRAQIGDPILQPGPFDGGVAPQDIVAALSDFEPVDTTGGDNSFDAAIAEVSVEFDPEILGIGRVVGASPRLPALNLSVTKSGRTTGLTLGTIVDLAADITVDLQPGQANYVDQIGIQGIQNSMFSDGGDSGSLIVDAVEFAPVGLLFAGSPQQTFANPIQLVLQRFAAQIAT